MWIRVLSSPLPASYHIRKSNAFGFQILRQGPNSANKSSLTGRKAIDEKFSKPFLTRSNLIQTFNLSFLSNWINPAAESIGSCCTITVSLPITKNKIFLDAIITLMKSLYMDKKMIKMGMNLAVIRWSKGYLDVLPTEYWVLKLHFAKKYDTWCIRDVYTIMII